MVVGIDDHRDAQRDGDSVLLQRRDLLGVVGHQRDRSDAEEIEDLGSDVIAPPIGRKAELHVGVDRVDALLLQQPSRYYYETLTPSVFLRAAFRELQSLMAARPAIEVMVRLGLTHSLSGVLERLVELQCYSSEEKFRQLLGRSPHILQLVPHKYLANYLGIEATNFSKLINKVRI